ncbi:MAG: hypothetical protein KAS32_02195 [Candidatus Peribacteraceae bacterium]|nr:hypothetical protein [Candidatus Peribacteraceae bacterium]
MADDLTRVASNVCIYWETPELNSTLEDLGISGRCVATTYFSKSSITCYNDGVCNGFGTCRECRAYDVSHLKFSQKDTTHVYGTSFLLEWNSELNKYIPVRELSPDEASDDSFFLDNLTHTQKITSSNISGEQTPFNIAIYNLRARFKKCCNWQAAPFMFYKSKSGTLYARDYRSLAVQDYTYLSKNEAGEYATAVALSSSCSVDVATPWKTPFTEENPTAYGCNGCKPECPYYTGPKWAYCVDSKMEMGDKISAKQVLELRYYSKDWSKFSNPAGEYRKLFKDPEIYAWTGEFEHGGEAAEGVDDNPMVERVYINSFTGSSVSITKDSPEPATPGLRVVGNIPETTVSYPTLIKEIQEFSAALTISWPKNTSSSNPFVFRTFRIGQNTLRIYVDTPYIATVYVVNITTYPQGSKTNTEFISYMLKNHPVGLNTTEGSGLDISLLYFDVDLEYKPEQNQIKAFTRDPTSSTGTYLTDVCFIRHKLYHAVVAQTKGQDNAGHPRTEPWIDRFEQVRCEAQVLSISNSPEVDKVIWDSDAGGKLSMYPIEEILEHGISNWVSIGCNKAALTFDNFKCNSVLPWSTFGTSPRGVSLYLKVDRTNNPANSSDGVVPLQLELQSLTGSILPGNIIIVVPESGYAWSGGFDEKTDIISAKYYVTEYKQAPVLPNDWLRLKYPEYVNSYMPELPVEMSFDGSTLVAEGSSICISNVGGTEQKRIYDLVEVKEELYNRLKEEETKSISSFFSGGAKDKDIQSSSSIFEEIKTNFDAKYSGYIFCSDSQNVTLLEVSKRLGDLKFHEGDYTFLFIFKDETGRPIGSKRTSMLLQAAKPETRDVEVKYDWTMKLLAWPIVDSLLLLAKYNEPPAPDGEFEGPETYHPRCGDHSEEFLRTHYFGDPGPMWFPYNACLSPRYHETDSNVAVKCRNYVEGFGSGNSYTGSLDGKRWDYWERMRGPDMLSTHIAGTIFIVGCFYREVSYSYQLTDSQVFSGYTRIRSGNPHAQFAKDREALRASRHFLKRNMKVRNEMVTDLNSPNPTQWTDEYKQYIFTDPNDTSKGILVGDEQETPVWVHLSDGVSRVNRTTPYRQHPFAHYILQSVGDYEFNEQFSYEDSNRHRLSSVIEDRDLTTTAARSPDGSLIFVPGDPVYMDEFQNYDDIVPVYKDQNTAWAWLERTKDIEREQGNQIGGINLYNPTVNVWKTDRESASFTNEGPNTLSYTPPTFNNETGALETTASFAWASGPARYLNWFSGAWLEDDPLVSGYTSIYSQLSGDAGLDLFGRGTGGNSFLASPDGRHQYVHSTTNSGTEFRYSVRGVGVDSVLQTDILPYTLSDVVQDNSLLYLEISKINDKFSTTGSNIFIADSRGYFYIESVDITWKYGSGQEQSTNGEWVDVRYDIPNILIYTLARDITGATTQAGLVATSEYERSTSGELQETVGADGAVYTYKGNGFKKVNYPAQSWAGVIKLEFGSLRADARANIETIEIWYRRPKAAVETVMNYEQKVNISVGNTGTPDYRKMLYYYSRTLVDYNDGTAYSQLEGDLISAGQLSPSLKSVKFTNRTVKDVILEYEYSDPTGTRFPYNSKTHPEKSSIAIEDSDNYWHVPDELNICTKSRTLVGHAHVDDNPQYTTVGNSTEVNKKDVSDNENTALCSDGVGDNKLGERIQECLYSEASGMLGGDITTIYKWFWHPDELSFWEGIMGLSLPGKSLTLTLTSVIPEMYRVYQHEHFGSVSELSTTFSDGHLHEIPPWQALGHRLYVGTPKFNRACYDVVVFKIQDHIGEDTYGTSEYGGHISSGGTVWPYETYRDKNYYLDNNIIEVGGYMGGSIGGAGPLFWAAQTQLSHGFTAVQQDTAREVDERVYGGREDAVRADASRSHLHSDEPV